MTRSVTARGELRGHLKSLHSLDSSVPASALFVCACERSRKVVPLIACPTFASVLPPFAEVSAECPLSSAVQRRGGGAGSSLARWGDSLNFFHLHRHSDRQAMQASKAGRQAGGHKAAAVKATELRQYCFRSWLAK